MIDAHVIRGIGVDYGTFKAALSIVQSLRRVPCEKFIPLAAVPHQ